MITKEKIINGIKQMQNPISIDDLLDEIILLEKIENGMEQVHKGKSISDAELDKKLHKWLD